jgi:hypothetical protein
VDKLQESRRRLAAAWAGAAVVLAACGGGGGGGATAPTGATVSAAPVAASSDQPIGIGFSEANGTSSPGPQAVAPDSGGSAASGPPASPPPSAAFAQRIVNSDPAGDQSKASLAPLAGGGHLVAWTVAPPPGGTTGSVCWLRLDASSSAAGAQRCMAVANLWTGSGSATTSVAPAGTGALVSWQVMAGDGSGVLDVQVQRVDAAGAPFCGPVLANATTAGDQGYSASAGLAGGGAVVVWRDNPTQSIRMQRYDASGAAAGGETRVDAGAGGDRMNPAVTGLVDGGFVVAWSGQQPGTSGSAVYTRRFAADGTPLGGETLVSDAQAVGLYPRLAGLTGGGYVVAFNNGSAAVAQRFAADGSASGARISLDADWLATAPDTCYRPYPTSCPPFQVISAIGALDDGGFVALWGNSTGISLSHGLFGRRFAADGTAGSVQQVLNPSAMGSGHQIRATGDGGFLLAWNGADSDLGGVLLERFGADALN